MYSADYICAPHVSHNEKKISPHPRKLISACRNVAINHSRSDINRTQLLETITRVSSFSFVPDNSCRSRASLDPLKQKPPRIAIQ